MKPIEQLLDTLDWQPVEMDPSDDGLPFATHSGVLEIAGHKFRCFRLNDGRAVFHADDVNAFFGEPNE